MNQRIKKFAEDAELTYGAWAVPDFILERFANSIVSDCAEFARLHNLKLGDRSYMIHTAIKERFGVEAA